MNLLWVGLLALAVVQSARPPEAIDADRAAAMMEVHDLERRARLLDEEAALRRDQLRRHLRTLYKLSSGGYLRLLASADSATSLIERRDAARRLIARDLEELRAVRDEAHELDSEQARRASELARAIELDRQFSSALSQAPVGLWAHRGHLVRPVAGSVLSPFGPYRDPETRLELSRRGAELRSRPGEPVHAIAAGEVRWIGEVPGLGPGIAVDHGDGYLSITARIDDIRVSVGQTLAAGALLGVAAGPSVYLELAQAGTPLNPAPWLAH